LVSSYTVIFSERKGENDFWSFLIFALLYHFERYKLATAMADEKLLMMCPDDIPAKQNRL